MPASAQPLAVVDEIAAQVSAGSQLRLQLSNGRFQLVMIVVATSLSSPAPARVVVLHHHVRAKPKSATKNPKKVDSSKKNRQFQQNRSPVPAKNMSPPSDSSRKSLWFQPKKCRLQQNIQTVLAKTMLVPAKLTKDSSKNNSDCCRPLPASEIAGCSFP